MTNKQLKNNRQSNLQEPNRTYIWYLIRHTPTLGHPPTLGQTPTLGHTPALGHTHTYET